MVIVYMVVLAGGITGCGTSVDEQKHTQSTESTKEILQDDTGEIIEEADTTETSQANDEDDDYVGIRWGALQYEFLSYEIFDNSQIQEQTTYLSNYFYDNQLPEKNYESVLDREAAGAECPELKAYWEDDSDSYSVQEIKRLYDENDDVIQKYTTMVPVDTYYIFVKCKVTNLRETGMEASLDDISVMASGKDNSTFTPSWETICYFDKSVHTVGADRENNYYRKNFAPNEAFECVLGFAVIVEDIEEPDYYIGVYSGKAADISPNPAFCDWMINIDEMKTSME